MKAQDWDKLWQDKERFLLWGQPDREVSALLPMLRKEKIHRVLDLGCGLGRHVIFMSKEGFDIHAVDSSKTAVAYCQEWLNKEGLTAHVSAVDMDNLDYPDDYFDFVLSWNVIYHTTREHMIYILSEISRILRKDGLLYLTLNSLKNEYYGKGIEVENNTFDNPNKEDGQHLHHYSDENDVKDLLKNWLIESMKEAEESLEGKKFPGSWHWMILARNIKK